MSIAVAFAAISWHFERDPIPYALETDWPVGAAGFEPLHQESCSGTLAAKLRIRCARPQPASLVSTAILPPALRKSTRLRGIPRIVLSLREPRGPGPVVGI
jgi:hypothetical protein